MICVFKCVGCGDQMHYSIRRKMLACDTCGAECEIENYDMDYVTYEGKTSLSDSIELLSCPTCGARISLLEGSAKLRCSYCHSELAAFGVRTDEQLSPEKIIPCKLTYNEAHQKLATWWLSHETMPKFDEKKLKVKFQDIYVPVWLVNADVTAHIKAEVRHFDCYDGNNSLPPIVHSRSYHSKFHSIPFDSSCHIQDEQFYDIEPYHFGGMQDFNASFLSGHAAECYHFGPEHTLPRAIGRLKKFAKEQCEDQLESDLHGARIHNILYEETDVTPTEMIYVLVPMWVCTYVFQGKTYNVYINGQTGKVAGQVLLAGHKFQRDLTFYGICTFMLGLPLALLFVLFLMQMFTGSRFNLAGGSLILAPILLFSSVASSASKVRSISTSGSADGRTYHRNPFTGGINAKNINQEVQIRQGMKVSALASGLTNLIPGLLLIPAIFLFILPLFRIYNFDPVATAIFSIIGGVLFALVKTFTFSKLLLLYETYQRKTDYINYVKLDSIEQIDGD